MKAKKILILSQMNLYLLLFIKNISLSQIRLVYNGLIAYFCSHEYSAIISISGWLHIKIGSIYIDQGHQSSIDCKESVMFCINMFAIKGRNFNKIIFTI